jgi:uncharacterized protein (DUF2147 family)
MNKIKLLFAATILLFTFNVNAQKDQLCKVWYNQEKTSKVEVFQVPSDGTFAGKIVWLKEPVENGKPKTDKENPDEKLRSKPLMGLLIFYGLKKSATDPNLYEDGRIYDPKNGKKYDCKMTFKGASVDLRGYIHGMPFLGRTSNWTLSE